MTERALADGDRIRLGRNGGAELLFRLAAAGPGTRAAGGDAAVADLRQVAALLEGLRALGSARVLDDVLVLVMDSAIAVSGAERGFIMLANDDGTLDLKMARARGRQTLPGSGFETSRKIPEEVFRTGRTRIEADLLDGDLASVHVGTVALGIRHVLCVPLRLMQFSDAADAPPAAEDEQRRIGVLYLDSRDKAKLLSPGTGGALETLANEAAVAIRNAELYRAALENARLEREMETAAEIPAGPAPEPAAVRRVLRSGGGDVAVPGHRGRLLRLHRQARRGARLRPRRRGREGASGRPPRRVDAGLARCGGQRRGGTGGDADHGQHRAGPPRHPGALRDALLRRAVPGRAPALLQRRP